jgi:endonuclease/exonuclease/phosphatase family metal-dependent hydrolase
MAMEQWPRRALIADFRSFSAALASDAETGHDPFMARLRLATFNLENLDWSPSRLDWFGRRVAALAPVLDRLDADILCLQEVAARKIHKHGPREPIGLTQLLARTRYADFHQIVSRRPGGSMPADVHNLAILSRWPMPVAEQVHHDLVAPWTWRPPEDNGIEPPPIPISWDRPLLRASIETPTGALLHIVNLHLRAPRPTPATSARGVGSSRSLVEGQFVAAMKRDGQALEARLYVDRLFDEAPDAMIAVCGDFNADEHDAPTRLLRAGEPEARTGRALSPLEERVPPARRHTVIHAGRPALIDHILASPALTARWRETEIFNDGLADEVTEPDAVATSLHAPVVVRFEM